MPLNFFLFDLRNRSAKPLETALRRGLSNFSSCGNDGFPSLPVFAILAGIIVQIHCVDSHEHERFSQTLLQFLEPAIGIFVSQLANDTRKPVRFFTQVSLHCFFLLLLYAFQYHLWLAAFFPDFFSRVMWTVFFFSMEALLVLYRSCTPCTNYEFRLPTHASLPPLFLCGAALSLISSGGHAPRLLIITHPAVFLPFFFTTGSMFLPLPLAASSTFVFFPSFIAQ